MLSKARCGETGVEMIQPLQEAIQWFIIIKFHIQMPHRQAFLLYYARPQRCTVMYIAILFIICTYKKNPAHKTNIHYQKAFNKAGWCIHKIRLLKPKKKTLLQQWLVESPKHQDMEGLISQTERNTYCLILFLRRSQTVVMGKRWLRSGPKGAEVVSTQNMAVLHLALEAGIVGGDIIKIDLTEHLRSVHFTL